MFFSHSSQDADWVERVGAQATAAGVEVYLAEHEVSPGQQLSQKVTEASDAVIVLLSKNSLASVYVQQEIGVAHHAGKLVIPILMEEVVGTDLGVLNGREYVLLDRAAPHDGLSKLSVALTQLIEQQRRQMIDEAQERLRQQMAAEPEARLRQQLAEMQRRNQQDFLVVGGVLLVLGLIIMSQSAG